MSSQTISLNFIYDFVSTGSDPLLKQLKEYIKWEGEQWNNVIPEGNFDSSYAETQFEVLSLVFFCPLLVISKPSSSALQCKGSGTT